MFESIINCDSQILVEKALEFAKNEDYTNYAIHLTMACNLNNEEATRMISQDSFRKLLMKQDFNVTRHFYQETSKFPTSANNLGYVFELELDYEKAFQLYQFASDKGLISATYNLATCYSRGRGVPRDVEKCVELCKLCVQKGHINSMLNLGNIYYNKKDFEKALKYYEMAHDVDHLIVLYQNYKIRDKKYVTEYLLNLGKEELLKKIYKYDDFDINFLKENHEMKKELHKLKTENAEMKSHILASPDGPLYFEALEQWKHRL